MTAPAVRLSAPADVVGLVTQLCGYRPQESLVVVSLRGPRRRVGLTVRVDLPDAADEGRRAADLARRVAVDGALAALVVVHTEQPGDLPRAGLVAAVTAACRSSGVAVEDGLLVRAGRWHSYACTAACCPPEGTALPDEPSPALVEVQARQALAGRAVLASREQLAASLAPPVLVARAAARRACEEADRRHLLALADGGRAAVVAGALRRWRAALVLAADPPLQLPVEHAAELAVGLDDVGVRDEVLTWGLDEPEALATLVLAVARATPPPFDAAVCAVLAWLAHARGDGAVAGLALDRALASDPQHALARLLRQALDRQVPPEVLRDVARAARGELDRKQPGP